MPIPFLLAFVVSPVGVWQGRFEVDLPLPAAGTPTAVRAKLERDLAALRKGRVRLTLKADHTYALHTTNLPMMGPVDTKGTWTQRGATVSVVEGGTKRPQALLLDPSGKRLRAPIRKGVVIVFVR